MSHLAMCTMGLGGGGVGIGWSTLMEFVLASFQCEHSPLKPLRRGVGDSLVKPEWNMEVGMQVP